MANFAFQTFVHKPLFIGYFTLYRIQITHCARFVLLRSFTSCFDGVCILQLFGNFGENTHLNSPLITALPTMAYAIAEISVQTTFPMHFNC